MSFDTLIRDQVANAYNMLGASWAVLSKDTNSLEDPATGLATTATQTCRTRAKLDATALKTLGFKFGDGLVQMGDIEASIPAKGLPFLPEPGDNLSAIGKQFKVICVRPAYAPGGMATEYTLLVRL